MIVFKFGGASVKSAEAVRSVAGILKKYEEEEIVVVVSAMGKTTNALERVVESYQKRDRQRLDHEVQMLRDFHMDILNKLFEKGRYPVFQEIEDTLRELSEQLEEEPALNYDYDYDRIICYGELLSSRIIAGFLNSSDIPVRWMDIRKSLKSDNTYREARIDWELSTRLAREHFIFRGERILLTQGFLASTINNQTTSLGREGSDYTAAILAHILRADSVTIWKDVPGVLNADPKYFDDTILLEKLSYLDAIELAYFGTGVIHPKTIKPLQNKNINLYVKSFLNPDARGTLIGNFSYDKLVPSFIFKMDQVLIRTSPRDFSFITEDNLEEIFGILHKNGMKINLMQNSAVSFQMIVNNDKRKLHLVVDDLDEKFRVSIQTGLELITIRYFDQSTIDRVMINKELILEQRGVQNIQLLVRDLK
ncbi:MAG: aspartate kinase [Bacteroidales bacterium]|nr:aspartate kinase [Bacteroidales bacterium]MBN2699735.1 aspartate kinase [Bacteroidales bacterium]